MGELLFGDIVVVEGGLIGVVVKSWINFKDGEKECEYEVYVRNWDCIVRYEESKVQRYRVRHKYLNEEELAYQNSRR